MDQLKVIFPPIVTDLIGHVFVTLVLSMAVEGV